MQVAIVLLAQLVYCWGATRGMQFDVSFGTQKCFTDTVPVDATVHLEVRVSTPLHSTRQTTDMPIDFIMTNARGIAVAHESGITHSKFTIPFAKFQSNSNPRVVHRAHHHHTREDERLRFCLMHQVHANHVPLRQRRRIALTLNVARALPLAMTDADQPLLREHVSEMGSDVQRLEKELNRLLFRMDDLRAADDVLTEANAASARQLMMSSVLTVAFIVGVSTLQLSSIVTAIRKRRHGA